MRFRPVRSASARPRPAAAQPGTPAPADRPAPAAPPQMDNPYSRHFTQPRTLDSLRRNKTP